MIGDAVMNHNVTTNGVFFPFAPNRWMRWLVVFGNLRDGLV